jgi:hypothetical protein
MLIGKMRIRAIWSTKYGVLLCRRKDQVTQKLKITKKKPRRRKEEEAGRIKKQETFRVGILSDTVTLRLITKARVKLAHKIPRMLAVILVEENNRSVNYAQNIESLLKCIVRTNL